MSIGLRRRKKHPTSGGQAPLHSSVSFIFDLISNWYKIRIGFVSNSKGVSAFGSTGATFSGQSSPDVQMSGRWETAIPAKIASGESPNAV